MKKKGDTVLDPPPFPRPLHHIPPLPRRKRTTSRRTRRQTSRRRDEKEKKKNPTNCKHCAKYGGDGLIHGPPNKVLPTKCNYNKKWTGWRPEWVCKKIRVEFKEYDECSK